MRAKDTAKPMSAEAISQICKKLMEILVVKGSRRAFFSELSRQLQRQFPFDRLCINLYDANVGMLMYFTAAEGTVVNTLSPVRPAEESTTVAGHVIATRRPVIITDFAEYFSDTNIHPIAEVGLKATMAFPLFLDNKIIATLHCSFAETPPNIYEITSFMLELTPIIATCLGAILSTEQHTESQPVLSQPLLPLEDETSIICHSNAMRDVIRKVEAIAALDIPILLLGETGTGKSMLAQYIHRRSPRKDAHFVKVNCPALSPSLFESELFGHAKGAFTGASSKRVGRFELAHGGTMFLDEIGELSMEMQSKLLQVLDESSFERVGESVSLAVNVRFIAATNINISAAIASNKMRADLYHRLSLCTIELPPLRQRMADIPPLITAMSAQLADKLNVPRINFNSTMLRALSEYSWPGNIRELRNVVSRILIYNNINHNMTESIVHEQIKQSSMLAAAARQTNALSQPATNVLQGHASRGELVGAADDNRQVARHAYAAAGVTGGAGEYGLPDEYAGATRAWGAGSAAPTGAVSQTGAQAELSTLEDFERKHICEAIQQCMGVISGSRGAAAKLGLPRSTLLHRMKKLGINPKAIISV